ncbi:transposase [Streptomyces sp. NPDC003635]
MEVIHERCAGIDFSKVDVKVCIRVPSSAGNRRRSEVRTFSAMTFVLPTMRDWLLAEPVSVVRTGATCVYWKAVFYLMEHELVCWLLNARPMKSVHGRKSATVSNSLGVSGRAMREALMAGERGPHALADLAKGSMRRTTDALVEEVLTGNLTAHHAFLARAMLDRIDACTVTEARLSEHIEVMLQQPVRRRIELLVTIPGVEARAAQVILAESGDDIGRFPRAADLAFRAGVCPDYHQSGGRTGSGKTRHGDPCLKAALGQAAVSAPRTKDTYLAARCRRIVARRGSEKRALVALEHSILIVVWHVFTHDTEHADVTGQYFIERTGRARRPRRLVSQLSQLGDQATLQAEAAA